MGKMGPAEEAVIRTRDLSKIYQVGDSRVVALNRVNLEFRRGTFTAVAGSAPKAKVGGGTDSVAVGPK